MSVQLESKELRLQGVMVGIPLYDNAPGRYHTTSGAFSRRHGAFTW